MFFRGKKSPQQEEQSDWVVQATNFIERTVDGLRDKAVVPLTTVARAIVYGLLAAMLGVAALVVFAIAFVRLLDVYLDNIPMVPENVWFAHFIAGGIFVVAGALLWSKRRPKQADHKA